MASGVSFHASSITSSPDLPYPDSPSIGQIENSGTDPVDAPLRIDKEPYVSISPLLAAEATHVTDVTALAAASAVLVTEASSESGGAVYTSTIGEGEGRGDGGEESMPPLGTSIVGSVMSTSTVSTLATKTTSVETTGISAITPLVVTSAGWRRLTWCLGDFGVAVLVFGCAVLM